MQCREVRSAVHLREGCKVRATLHGGLFIDFPWSNQRLSYAAERITRGQSQAEDELQGDSEVCDPFRDWK